MELAISIEQCAGINRNMRCIEICLPVHVLA